MKQIIVTVEQSGEIKIDAVGFKGAACEKATAAIERALGARSGGAKKPEFHATAEQRQSAGGAR